ncbi:hypothetical protein HHK36_012661 [Tetracentron sinense]|uniref:XS domain-containing protein n=1 Tax=Tetracentron sinense TaxID=13715 RepID=A0A834Z951_TETSI|nr:hypothetical protein HHK36_012661 [Tetracentron sinense]
MKSQKMAGGNPKGSSHKPSPSSSHRKTRWESDSNPPSAHDSAAPGDSKPTKPSSSSKDAPSPGPNPGPSKLMLDGVPPSGPSPFPPPGAGAGAGARFPFPDPADMGPPPPSAYGFHMLERRTIVLADGSVRSYFALPPDYQDFPAQGRPMGDSERFLPFGSGSHGPEPGGPGGLGFNRRFPPGGPMSPEGFRHDRDERFGRGGQFDYWNSLGLDGRNPMPQEGSLKRKYGDEDERDVRDGRDEFARQRQQLLHYGNPSSNPNGFPLGSGDRADYLAGTSSPFRRDQMESGRGIDDLRSSKHMKVGGDYGNLPSKRALPGDFVIPKLPDVDPHALKKAFLRFVKLLNENESQKKNYLEDGKHGPLQCLVCDRSMSLPHDSFAEQNFVGVRPAVVAADDEPLVSIEASPSQGPTIGWSRVIGLLPCVILENPPEYCMMQLCKGFFFCEETPLGRLTQPSFERAKFVDLILKDANGVHITIFEGGMSTGESKDQNIFMFNGPGESKDFPDVHGLIMHAYNIQNSDLHVDHLGLHKALCVLMGWNYAKPPDNSKTYQSLSADEAAANKDDLIMWPPVVIIHNTNTGRGKGGRMEGMGNKVMDTKLRDLGFGGGKSRAMYGKDGHMGTTSVKFAGDQSGLREAMRLAEFFKKDNHGREGWARAQFLQSDKDDENNPNLVKVDERTGKKNRILYGYLGTASDMDRVDFESRNRAAIESRKELEP